MADYQCFPIWGNFDNYDGSINPILLPITDELKEMFNKWRVKYDKILDNENPQDSGFKTKEEEVLFEEQGILLWKMLVEQMDDVYKISYFSELKNKEFTSMEDYLSS